MSKYFCDYAIPGDIPSGKEIGPMKITIGTKYVTYILRKFLSDIWNISLFKFIIQNDLSCNDL